MALADPAHASHTAIQSGGWFKGARWDTGTRPGDGARVWIPAGFTMTINNTAGARIQSIRVDGVLKFQTNKSRDLHVDTIVVGMGGRLEMGTAAKPIENGTTARLIIDDYNGEFEVTDDTSADYDPLTIGQGLIVMGELEIHGAIKTPYTTLTTDPLAGDTVLYLDALPADWSVGDFVLLAGTQIDAEGDETREIVSINAASQSLVIDTPLAFDHVTPTTSLAAGTLKVHVANVTRNAIIETESSKKGATSTITTSFTDNSFRETTGDQFWSRGHIMCMNNNFDVRYAGFYGLGRMNKLIAAEDTLFDETNTITQIGRNQRARYSFHAHQTGVSEFPGHIEGCSILDSPGWGVVNHSSYVDIINNVAHDTAGGAFVSEAGDEVGSFIGNLAVRNHGDGETEAGRGDLDDWGHKGSGFWFQGSPGLFVKNNIASGSTGEAFSVYADPIEGVSTIETIYLKNPQNYSEDSISISRLSAHTFEDNVCYGSHTGFAFFTSRSDYQLDQTVIENCKGWSILQGTLSFYASGYHYKNLVLVNDIDAPRGTAINSHHGTANVIYDDSHIEGFVIGLQAPRFSRSNAINRGYYNNLVNLWIDPGRFLSGANESDIYATEVHISEPQFGTLSGGSITTAQANYEEARVISGSNGEGDRNENLIIPGQIDIFTDYHIYPGPPHLNNIFTPFYYTLDLGSEGCYRVYSEAHQKPGAVLFTSAIMNAAGGGDDKNSKIPTQLWDMTNADIASAYTNQLQLLSTLDSSELPATYHQIFRERYTNKILTDPDWVLAPGGRLLPADYATNSGFIDSSDSNTLAGGGQLRLLQTALESVSPPLIEVAVDGTPGSTSHDFGNVTAGDPASVRVDISNLGDAPLDVWISPPTGSGGIAVELPVELTGFFGPHLSLWKSESGYLDLKWSAWQSGLHNTVVELRTTDTTQPIYTLNLTGSVTNVPPTTAIDEYVLMTSSETDLPVLENDSDLNGETLEIISISNPASGIAYISGDNNDQLTYRATAAFWADDTFTYTVSDGNGGQATETVVLKAPHKEDSGVLAMEGENFAFIYHTDTYPNHTWTETTIVADSSGGSSMASSDLGDQPKTNGPSLDFPVVFTTPGTYYVWARLSSPQGNNSHGLLVGMDGVSVTDSGSGLSNTSANWTWDNSTNKISQLALTITAAGTHTINVWMNKDGVRLDSLYLTTDPLAIPSGQLSAESARSLD